MGIEQMIAPLQQSSLQYGQVNDTFIIPLRVALPYPFQRGPCLLYLG